MVHFVLLHLRDHFPAALVIFGQNSKMPLEVIRHLSFGLGHETEIPLVTRNTGEGANCK